jgi:hypothetical protein
VRRVRVASGRSRRRRHAHAAARATAKVTKLLYLDLDIWWSRAGVPCSSRNVRVVPDAFVSQIFFRSAPISREVQAVLDEVAEAAQDKFADAMDAAEKALAAELGQGKAKAFVDEAWRGVQARCEAAADKFELYAARNVFARDEAAVARGKKRRQSEEAAQYEREAERELEEARARCASVRRLRHELAALVEQAAAEDKLLFGRGLAVRAPEAAADLRPLWETATAAVALLERIEEKKRRVE